MTSNTDPLAGVELLALEAAFKALRWGDSLILTDAARKIHAAGMNNGEGLLSSYMCQRFFDAYHGAKEALARPTAAVERASPDAGQAELEEMHEIGRREGYADAVQELDEATGGDGEYRYCTNHDPERHCPDPAAMKARIIERFNTRSERPHSPEQTPDAGQIEAVARAIEGPHCPVPEGYPYTLDDLRRRRWAMLEPAKQQTRMNQAKAALSTQPVEGLREALRLLNGIRPVNWYDDPEQKAAWEALDRALSTQAIDIEGG